MGPKIWRSFIDLACPKDCLEVDSDWRSAETDSGINDFKKLYSFNMAINEKI